MFNLVNKQLLIEFNDARIQIYKVIWNYSEIVSVILPLLNIHNIVLHVLTLSNMLSLCNKVVSVRSEIVTVTRAYFLPVQVYPFHW